MDGRLLGWEDEPDAEVARRHDIGLDDLVLEAGEVLGGERERAGVETKLERDVHLAAMREPAHLDRGDGSGAKLQ